MPENKVVYIAGAITGVDNYWEPFEKAEQYLKALGYVVLNPARHPAGMTKEQYMRICFAMIDSADLVFFLPGWRNSKGANVEWNYCKYIEKPVVYRLKDVEVVVK